MARAEPESAILPAPGEAVSYPGAPIRAASSAPAPALIGKGDVGVECGPDRGAAIAAVRITRTASRRATNAITLGPPAG